MSNSAGQMTWKTLIRSPRSLQVMYPRRLNKAKADIAPQVHQNTGQGIPRLLPGPGDNPTARRKRTHAIFVEARVKHRLREERGVTSVCIHSQFNGRASQRVMLMGKWLNKLVNRCIIQNSHEFKEQSAWCQATCSTYKLHPALSKFAGYAYWSVVTPPPAHERANPKAQEYQSNRARPNAGWQCDAARPAMREESGRRRNRPRATCRLSKYPGGSIAPARPPAVSPDPAHHEAQWHCARFLWLRGKS
jgi:hypothetical protein